MTATATTTSPTSEPPALLRRVARDSFVALMYHNVCEDVKSFADLSPSATSYFVTKAEFRAHLDELLACGGACMTWEELNAFYEPAGPAGDAGRAIDPPVLVTFDDGWKESVDLGGPALEQHQSCAIIFVTTDFLGQQHFLSRADLSKLDRRFRIGSHAQTHRMLSLLSDSEVRSELSDSKRLLEDLAGYAVDSLSIPSGAVDERVRRIALDCGYRFVFDSDVRVNRRGDSPVTIGRVAVSRQTTLHDFRRYVQGRLGRERLRRTVLSAPKRVLGLRRYEKLRRRLLGEKQGQQVTHES